MMSTAHAAVVKKAPVRYNRDIKGISIYLQTIKATNNGVRNRSEPWTEFVALGIDDHPRSPFHSKPKNGKEDLPRHNIDSSALIAHCPNSSASCSKIHCTVFRVAACG